jgi:hypothetical protein
MLLFPKGTSSTSSFMPRFNVSRSAQWGFHPGGWGKPPLDEYNRPLYGDVFGVLPKVNDADVSYAKNGAYGS